MKPASARARARQTDDPEIEQRPGNGQVRFLDIVTPIA